jgi:hypothetical protein
MIAAVAGFLIINATNYGACIGDAGSRSCLIGDTVVSDETTLLLVYTPLVFAPVAYLVAALVPVWRQPLGLGSQIVMIVAALSVVASGFAVLGWGAGTGAVVAFAVAAAGLVIGIGSWRKRQSSGA